MEEENWSEALIYFDIAKVIHNLQKPIIQGICIRELGQIEKAKIAYTNAMNNNDRDNKAAQALQRLTN